MSSFGNNDAMAYDYYTDYSIPIPQEPLSEWQQRTQEKELIITHFRQLQGYLTISQTQKETTYFTNQLRALEELLGEHEKELSYGHQIAVKKLLGDLQKHLGALWCSVKGVGPTGGFCMKEGMYVVFDKNLARELGRVFAGKSVYDFGARTGLYSQYFVEHGGALKAKAYDAAPNVEEFTKGNVLWADLSVSQEWEPFDWVLSLEVGEHIPKEYENLFIDNLHRHNKEGIILSWAVPNQSGNHHVNNRPNSYIKDKITALGYTNDISLENLLRNTAGVKWFKNTLMVFRKINN